MEARDKSIVSILEKFRHLVTVRFIGRRSFGLAKFIENFGQEYGQKLKTIGI